MDAGGSGSWTVGEYLVRRIEQAGVRHVFGVPGDYVLGFLDCIVAGELDLITTCNELNAGYAADGYARVHGVSAVVVTYDVGGLSLLNAVAGSHAERVPVIVVSGAPSTDEIKHPHVLHHTTGDLDVQLNAYRAVTETTAKLLDPALAPDQIDSAIAACLREQRPVYIEIPMDLVGAPCRGPSTPLGDLSLESDTEALREAVEETAAMLESASTTTVMAGIEAWRLQAVDELTALIEQLGCPFVTTGLGKTVLPEDHPQFAGVYAARMGQDGPREVVENADVVLSLGNLMTDYDLGFYTALLDTSRLVVVNSNRVRVKHHLYQNVTLPDFIAGLRKRLPAVSPAAHSLPGKPWAGARGLPDASPAGGATALASSRRLTTNHFYRRVNDLLAPGDIVVADVGATALGAIDLLMPHGSLFLMQAFYMSMGWSIPATLGAGSASPSSRVFTFVGDGALQFTAQELSTIIRHEQNPVIFVLDNAGYTVERVIHDGPYNDIQPWQFDKLPELFGASRGLIVRTEGDLEQALDHIQTHVDEVVVVDVQIDRMDVAEGMKGLVAIGGRSTPPPGS